MSKLNNGMKLNADLPPCALQANSTSFQQQAQLLWATIGATFAI